MQYTKIVLFSSKNTQDEFFNITNIAQKSFENNSKCIEIATPLQNEIFRTVYRIKEKFLKYCK